MKKRRILPTHIKQKETKKTGIVLGHLLLKGIRINYSAVFSSTFFAVL